MSDTPYRVVPLVPDTRAIATTSPTLLTAPPPLALYVHYPWCVRKCPYCDFNSHTRRDGTDPKALERAYIDALIADLELATPAIHGRRIETVFFGGGTPSLMSATGLGRLLATIRSRVSLDPTAEITLEANPGTIEAQRFRDYRSAGVNRLSIGIQSFDDRHLARLGRIHDSREARAAIDTALAHFDRVNIDLMYALPEQGIDEALQDTTIALASGVSHLSCYHLTLEPNTPFHRTPPPLPDSDTSADMQEAIEARLADAGFINYETSAFAKPGQQCRHNLNYWTFGDYLGIGAGAHGKLSGDDGIVREMRHKHPQHYLGGARSGRFLQERNAVARTDLPFEFMMNALRLTDGVPLPFFEARTGLTLTTIADELARARSSGLLEPDMQRIRPTLRGRRFLNDLLELFLPTELA